MKNTRNVRTSIAPKGFKLRFTIQLLTPLSAVALLTPMACGGKTADQLSTNLELEPVAPDTDTEPTAEPEPSPSDDASTPSDISNEDISNEDISNEDISNEDISNEDIDDAETAEGGEAAGVDGDEAASDTAQDDTEILDDVQGDLTVLLIADRSGSMAQIWETENRWLTASRVLLEQIDLAKDHLTVGALIFPLGADSCGVPPFGELPQIDYLPASDFVATWKDTLLNLPPDGSTPMGLAFRMADQAITQAQEQGLMQQRFRVIVLTDGEPNCDTIPGELEEFAVKWYELGVETNVLGLPGSSSGRALLDRIAEAGGTGAYQPQQTSTQLGSSTGALLQ